MKYTLRPYQIEAVEAILANRDTTSNDLIVLPTGAGKSLVIAEAAHRLDARVLILSPSREITAQNKTKMLTYRPPEEVGVYSASFRSREVRRFTFATIQSVYKKPELFQDFDFVFIDEAHTCTESGVSSMFNSFFSVVSAKVFGFTATPYRVLRLEPLYEGDYIINRESLEMIVGSQFLWDSILIAKNYRDLIRDGYLSTVENVTEFRDPDHRHFLRRIAPRDYKTKEFFNRAARLKEGVIVFCKNLKQAEALCTVIEEPAAVVIGSMKTKDRDEVIEKFKTGKIKILLNYEALLTGFDAPHIDLVVLLRSFSSLSQYIQAVGRGTRLSEGKVVCEVVDLADNFARHGSIESVNVLKVKGVWLVADGTRRLDQRMKKSRILKPSKRFRR